MKIKKYVNDLIDKLGDSICEDDISQLVEKIEEEYNIICNYFYAGSYNSPGYYCEYYNIVWFLEDELEAVSVQCEYF